MDGKAGIALREALYQELPRNISARNQVLLADAGEIVDNDKEFENFLGQYVPNYENLQAEQRWNLYLGAKIKRKRPATFNKEETGKHRGKKRLSGKEKRDLGMHKINKSNKTFKMFLPMNDMWKEYAESVISLKNFSTPYEGEYHDSRTELIQRKVRKIEYFGCLLRVTKSRCSEYIGITGIVIKETKNTFVMICPDDKVKTIPKLHSEFSFVISGLGFSISGNYLQQRSLDRAKYNYKKVSFWL